MNCLLKPWFFVRFFLVCAVGPLVANQNALACSPKPGLEMCGTTDVKGIGQCPKYCDQGLVCDRSNPSNPQCVADKCPIEKRCSGGMPRPGQPPYQCCAQEQVCVKIPGTPYGRCETVGGVNDNTGSGSGAGGNSSGMLPPQGTGGIGRMGGNAGSGGKPVGNGPAFCSTRNSSFQKQPIEYCINDKQQMSSCSQNMQGKVSANRKRFITDHNFPLTAKDVHLVCQKL